MQICSWLSPYDPKNPNHRLKSTVAKFYGDWGREATEVFVAQINLLVNVFNTRIAALRKKYVIYKHG